MAPTLKTLLAAVLADPDDRRALLVYADALTEAGDPRGELIQLQVQLEELGGVGGDDPRRKKLERAAAKLEKVHRREWLDGLPMVRQGSFRRGMLDSVVATADPFFAGLDELLAREPVRGIKLTKWKARAHAPALAALLRSRAMTAIDLSGCQIDGKQAQAIFAEADTSRLRELILVDDPLGVDGVRAIVSRPLPRLEVLHLGGSLCGAPGDEAVELLAACETLRSLRDLRLSYFGMTTNGAAVLARSPILATVEELCLQSNSIRDDGVKALAASPHLRRLRQLELGHSHMTDAGARALLASSILDGIRPPPGRTWAMTIWDRTNGVSKATRAALDARLGPGVIAW